MCALKQEMDFVSRVESISQETLDLCYQCGTCTASCPMNVPVRRLIRSAQLGLKDATLGIGDLWYCATCRQCEFACPRGVKITDLIHALRILSYDSKKSPKKLDEALWGVYEDGNPWKGKKAERQKWAEGLAVKDAEKTRQKYVLYVGCASSYDTRLQKVARSLVTVLNAAGVDFGILGNKESCCGDVIYNIGEEGFLQELVESNIKEFEKTGAEAIISISPHCFNMFRTIYPKYGSKLKSYHYTEILSELIDKDKLRAFCGAASTSTEDDGSKTKVQISYHDPCYLGRYHRIYEQPRKIIESLPNTALVEMKDSRENALCCGGGGGQMWMESFGERPSHQRILQATETGASIMATSCPYCVQNFEDAAKTKDVKNFKVMDVSELVANSISTTK